MPKTHEIWKGNEGILEGATGFKLLCKFVHSKDNLAILVLMVLVNLYVRWTGLKWRNISSSD